MVASKPKIPDPGPKASRTLGKGGPPSIGGRGVHAALAKGGDTKMAGRGDRTKTAPEDSAGKQHPGSTAHATSSRGSVLAEGGNEKMFSKQAAGPAKAGQTGKPVSDPKQASGGMSRPARPGECGT